MTSLFISYSRKDIETARKLTETFKGQGLDFWIDWEGIPPTVDWWKEIEKGIEEADIFLFLISPDSAKSKVCKQEIETATKNGKRLIPLVVRDIKGDEAPTELGHLNWIFIRESDNFDAAFAKLITAIKTDFDWVQTHRRLQVKALEWERKSFENSLLLHGKDLQEAESQITANAGKEPHLTNIQQKYLLQSRKITDRQRRSILTISIVATVIMSILAVFGFTQANIAQEQASIAQANAEEAQKQLKISRAGELSFLSQEVREEDFQVSLLLGIEAFRSWETPRAYGNLLDITISTPQLIRYMPVIAPDASVAFSPDGKYMVSAWCAETDQLYCIKSIAEVRELETGSLISSTTQEGIRLQTAAFMPDGENILLGGESVFLWNTTTGSVDSLGGGGSLITRLSISPNGKYFAEESWDGVLTLWDTKSLKVVEQWTATAMSDIAFSPDGKTLAYGMLSDEWRVIFLDLQTKEWIGEPITKESSQMAFSPDGKIMALVGSEVTLWNVETRSQIGQLPLQDGSSVSGISFGTDGNTLHSSQFNGDVIVWDLKSRQAGDILIDEAEHVAANAPSYTISEELAQFIKQIEMEDPTTTLSPDGKLLVSGGWEYLTFWDAETLTMIKQHPNSISGGQILQIIFSPNGDTLVSVNEEVILWDAITQEQIGEPLASQIQNIAYTPDGAMLGYTSYQYKPILEDLIGTIELWDISSQQKINKQPIEFQYPDIGYLSFYNLSFSPDAKIIMLSGEDGSTISWKLNPQFWIETSCLRAGRNFTHAEWERYFPNETYRKTCEQWALEPETTPTP